MPGFDVVEMNDMETLDDDYLPEAQRLCRQHGTILICDEVQAGMGRTGRLLSCEHWGLEPDTSR